MNANERIRRLEKQIEAGPAGSVEAEKTAFAEWLTTISDEDLQLVESYVSDVGEDPDNPERNLWTGAASYDEALAAIRERHEASNAV